MHNTYILSAYLFALIALGGLSLQTYLKGRKK